MYHTRNAIPAQELEIGTLRARTQEEEIRVFFEENADGSFTPFEVLEAMSAKGRNYALTSVRRAMTDLTVSGYLQKHSAPLKRRMGDFGVSNCVWSLNKERELNLFEG